MPEHEIPTPPSQGSPEAAHRRRYLLLLAVVAIGLVRLWYCLRLPVNTADVLRSVHTALYVLRDGPGVAGVPLAELDPGLRGVGWAGIGYSYPPLALPFYVVVAALSPTLFAAKLALTLVEGANAALVSRITGSRWLGVIYWGSPASIWWVSGEGQFEPWMALFMLGAVATVGRRPAVALALLGLGVNVKLSAILLLPWLLWRVWRSSPAALPRSVLAFALALVVPVAVAGIWYPVVGGLLGISGTLRYNPYYWNPLDPSIFLWNPGWLRATNAVVSYGVLALMVRRASKTPDGWAELGGAIAFVALVKASTLAQFWYFLLFPAFVMPHGTEGGGRDLRWWLVALAPLLDVRSLVELVVGPFGWTEVATYRGLSALTRLGIR